MHSAPILCKYGTRHFSCYEQNDLKTEPNYAGSSYYITQCIEKHLPRLLDLGMTAIICSHDQIANSVIVQCQQLGYRVPKDISIIGFDDLPLCAYTSPHSPRSVRTGLSSANVVIMH